jgi:hypothetical protein
MFIFVVKAKYTYGGFYRGVWKWTWTQWTYWTEELSLSLMYAGWRLKSWAATAEHFTNGPCYQADQARSL